LLPWQHCGCVWIKIAKSFTSCEEEKITKALVHWEERLAPYVITDEKCAIFSNSVGDARGPQELDLLDQLGHRAGVLLLQLLPLEVPHAPNGTQVGALLPGLLVTMEYLLGNEIFHPLGSKVVSCHADGTVWTFHS
jgi:hypothetical protein